MKIFKEQVSKCSRERGLNCEVKSFGLLYPSSEVLKIYPYQLRSERMIFSVLRQSADNLLQYLCSLTPVLSGLIIQRQYVAKNRVNETLTH